MNKRYFQKYIRFGDFACYAVRLKVPTRNATGEKLKRKTNYLYMTSASIRSSVTMVVSVNSSPVFELTHTAVRPSFSFI